MAFCQRSFQNKLRLTVAAALLSLVLKAQVSDSLYRFDRRYMPGCDVAGLYSDLQRKGYSDKKILGMGSFLMYSGRHGCGDQLMRLAIRNMDTVKGSTWHQYSVQNLKNGMYANAFEGVTKAVDMDAKEHQGYAGWVFLYYYRDYRRALKHLNAYDALTPGVTDFPVGESLDFLKGLCYYNLGRYDSAYACFYKDISWIIKDRGKEAVNSFSYFYAARCLDRSGKTKQALHDYELAMELNAYPVEAVYYAGLAYKSTDREKAKTYLQRALELAKKGYKQQDIYAELFDEVYVSEIEEALAELTKNKTR